MSNAHETALAMLHASLAAKLTGTRVVQRSFVPDLALADEADLRTGLLCLVNEGGADFAQYRGREGELAKLDVACVGYVLVDEAAAPVATEQAELALMQDVLDWVKDPGTPRPYSSVLPQSFTQSRQLEHPYGWFVLKLLVHT